MMKRYVWLRYPGFRDKAVTLTYDDGTSSDRKLIEIMSRYGLKGTFNINAGKMAAEPGGYALTMEEAVELYTSSGNEVAAHGYCHQWLTEMETPMMVYEVLQDRITLEKAFGIPVRGFAYAYGAVDDTVVEIMRQCGYVYARTTAEAGNFNIPTDWLRMPITCRHRDPRLMELTKNFLEGPPGAYHWIQTPRLFTLMGHSIEFVKDNNWNIIEEFGAYVGSRDDVWYATNREVYDYVKSFENLQFAADGSFVYNPGREDVYICFKGVNHMIPSGETVRLD